MSLIEADSMLRTQCLSKLMDMLFIFRRQVKDYTISSSDTSISSKKAKPIGFLFGIYHLEKVILQCNLPHVLFPPIRVRTLASTRFPAPQGTVETENPPLHTIRQAVRRVCAPLRDVTLAATHCFFGQHGRVFTDSPSLSNPYTLQLSKY